MFVFTVSCLLSDCKGLQGHYQTAASAKTFGGVWVSGRTQ